MERLTLFQRLKPEVKRELDKNLEKYKSVEWLYEDLKKNSRYRSLTMDQVDALYVFSGIDYNKTSMFDLRWGDNLFIEQVK
jgi:hypothetical protein